MSYTELKNLKATFRLLHQQANKKGFASDWPQKANIIMTEMIQQPPVADLDRRFEVYIHELETNPDFKNLVGKAKKDKALVCFGDLAESKSLETKRDLNLMAMELLAGLAALFLAVNVFLEQEAFLEDRFFYGLGGLVWLMVGLWFISSVAEIFGTFLTKKEGNISWKGRLGLVREMIVWASIIHPEKTVVFLRNLILAEKIWDLVNDGIKEKTKPMVVLDFHFGHAGMLKMLQWHRLTRRSLIGLYRPFIKDILNDPVRRDYFARLMVAVWNGESWELRRNYLVDSLEDL